LAGGKFHQHFVGWRDGKTGNNFGGIPGRSHMIS
jgi:hypothetical protein